MGVVANSFTIREVNFSDSRNFITSDNIREVGARVRVATVRIRVDVITSVKGGLTLALTLTLAPALTLNLTRIVRLHFARVDGVRKYRLISPGYFQVLTLSLNCSNMDYYFVINCDGVLG